VAGGAAGEFLESTAADWITSSFQIKPSADPSLMQKIPKWTLHSLILVA